MVCLLEGANAVVCLAMGYVLFVVCLPEGARAIVCLPIAVCFV